MSTEIAQLETNKGTVTFTQFYGGSKDGISIQITGQDITNPYAQLNKYDAYKTIQILSNWLKEVTQMDATNIKQQLNNLKIEEQTIMHETVTLQHWIDDLKVLDIPVRLNQVFAERPKTNE